MPIHNKKRKKGKNKVLSSGSLQSSLDQNDSGTIPLNIGGSCTADQCSFGFHPSGSAPSASAINSQQGSKGMTISPWFNPKPFQRVDRNTQSDQEFNNSSMKCGASDYFEKSKGVLAELTPELFSMMQQAVKQKILTAFLLTLSGECVTDYLKMRHYSSEQIYVINQIIRGLTLLALGSSLNTIIALPLANYLLAEYVGFNKERVSSITTGAVLTSQVLMSPIGLVKTSLIMAVGIGTSWVGTQVSKTAYNLVRNGLFSPQKNENRSDVVFEHHDEQRQSF